MSEEDPNKPPDQHLMREPEPLTFYEHQSAGERVWGSLKADVRFCVLAFKQEHAESWWYEIVSAIRKLNKILEVTVSFGLIAAALYLYFVYAYPFLGKRWTAIIILSTLVFILGAAVRATRLFHERTVGELNDKITELTNQLPAKDDLIKRLQENSDKLLTSLKIAKLGAGQAEGEFKYKISMLESERDSFKSQLEELRKWRVTFKVDKQSQVHYSHIEEMSHFTANLLMQFENTSEQDLTMYGVDLSLYKQDESGEEKKLDFNVRSIAIERYPKTSYVVNFSRGLKLIAGELSSPYLFRFDMEQLFIEELTADCFLRVTMSAMNQDPLSKDYVIDDWGLVSSNSFISERHQEPSQNIGSTPSSNAVHDFIGDARAAEEERQELVRNLEALLKEGISKLRQEDYSGAAFWEVEVKMRIEKGLGKWQAEEFSKETDIKAYPYPATSRHRADVLYTLTERLGAVITELKRG